MSEGAVWLHRKLMDSDIWTSGATTIQVMIGCLLMANWEDQQWYNRSLGKTQLIQRGSFVTTQESLSKKFNLTRQNIRTSLCNLTNMQFLTTLPTGRVTTITILKYNDYQKLVTRRVTDKLTSHQPQVNQPSTRLEERQEGQELKEGGRPPEISLVEYVNGWKRRSLRERQDAAVEIAERLKTYKLSFRVEEDIYNQLTAGGTHGNEERGGTSIFEQAAKRRRTQGLEKL